MELIKEKYKQTDVGLIPSDWEVKKIGEVLKVIGGGAFKSIDSTDIGVRWLKIANVGINQILWNDESFLPINFAGENKSFLLKEGDYVLALTRPLLDRKLKISKLKKQDVPALLNQRVGKIQVEENNDADFLYFVFQKHDVINGLLQSMAGTDPPNLGNRGIYNIDFAFPPTKTEQTLIATALSDADIYITSLEKLIAKKRNIKQGAMQKLLQPKEGWEVKKLGEIASIVRGASPRPIEDTKWFDENSQIGWVRISDVTKSIKYLFETTQKLSELGIKSSRYVEKGNLIMSICATVGRPILLEINVCIHDGFVVFRNPQIEKKFLYYFLTFIEKDWAKNGQTGSQMNLNTNLINTTLIQFPKEKSEQIRIANIIGDIDDELAVINKKLEKVKMVKQGMMQQLLTGKIRLV